MASNAVNTGGAGSLYIEANVIGTEAWNNRSLVSWAFYLNERVSSGSTWSGGGINASTTTPGFGLWSGTFGFDWRPSGLQSTLIASGTYWAPHNADGTGATIVAGTIGNTGTSGAGGPTTVDVYLALPTLKVIPGTPSGLTATYVSDTSTKLDWSQTSASNGQPTANRIEQSINGGPWTEVVTMSPSNSATVATAANRETEYRVSAGNSAGWSAYSNVSAPNYTTPGTPSSVAAAKDAGGNIDITFVENVDYAEHTHEVWHGTVVGGVVTWDGAALATLASGVLAYEHVTPNPAQQHRYRIRSKAGALVSPWVESNTVVLLTAPAKPTIPAQPAAANRAAIFRLPWVHNSIDSSPQSKYQWRWSTNGGTTWTTGAKTASTNQFHDFAANTWGANAAVTFQVRTKGAYDAGSDADASYSPWSDSLLVTFKSLPTATITTPANGSTLNDATLRVTVGFAQAEAATFVKAQLELLQGATLLETLESVNQVGITMATPVQNGVSYTVRARVQDSNGLWSSWVTSTFNVVYLAPVPAGVVLSYLPETGYGQIDLTIPAPGAGQSAATTVTMTRTIDGSVETLVQDYPVSASLTFLDTTPTIHGTNTYTITTKSALGAQTVVVQSLVTTECRRAYLSKGAGFNSVVVFGANLSVDESLSVASDTVEAAGRIKPIGLYGVETSVQLKVKSFIFARTGFSTLDQIRTLLLVPGKACYRDSSGRRVFGTVKGSISRKKVDRGDLAFTMIETS